MKKLVLHLKKSRGKKREDLAFIEHIHNFKNEGRRVIIELIEKYSYKKLLFSNIEMKLNST